MYCILVVGPPASGKSSFAEFLSEKIKIPMVSKDLIKEKLFDTIGFKSRNEKVNLGIASMDILYYFAEENMKVGQPFILENNFESKSKDDLNTLLEKYNYTPITVQFICDIDVLYKRFIERDQYSDRHRGHVVNTQYPEVEKEEYIPAPIEEFADKLHKRGMDNFQIGNNVIKVDTTNFDKVNYEDILDRIEEFKL